PADDDAARHGHAQVACEQALRTAVIAAAELEQLNPFPAISCGQRIMLLDQLVEIKAGVRLSRGRPPPFNLVREDGTGFEGVCLPPEQGYFPSRAVDEQLAYAADGVPHSP